MIIILEFECSMIDARIFPADIIDVCPPEYEPDDVVAQDCEEFEKRGQAEHDGLQRYPDDLACQGLSRSRCWNVRL